MTKDGIDIIIDTESEENYYMQIRNQVIRQIAYGKLVPGQSLPSVRQLAESAGINMHTARKAYLLLKKEGYLRVDNRKGATVDVSFNESVDMDDLMNDVIMLCAKAGCKGVSLEKIHLMLDEAYKKQAGEGAD
ncbi:MAG: GntR family transcriptional regulator [Lachnospiraceae bacterium]|nr:GntR family transcriptional regulator [Lachnospiraceae bacterium]